MKIAIASTDKTIDGDISLQGGRAPFYLFLNDQLKVEKVFKNPFASGGGGAGTAIAKVLEDEGVEKVIVGKVGGNMGIALQEAGIAFEERQESIQEYLRTLSYWLKKRHIQSKAHCIIDMKL